MGNLDSVRPIVLLGDSARRAVCSDLTCMVQTWLQTWRVESPAADSAIDLIPWDGSYPAAEDCATLQCIVAGSAVLGLQLLRTSTTAILDISPAGNMVAGPLSQTVARALAESLANLMLQSAGLSGVEFVWNEPTMVGLPKMATARWWQSAYHGVTLLLSPLIIKRLMPSVTEPAGNLVQRRAAIAEEKMRLHAVLGQADVSVADLVSLRENDVLVLTGGVKQPGVLQTEQGRGVARFVLGRVQNFRAVQIV
jgi:hypothetical protein